MKQDRIANLLLILLLIGLGFLLYRALGGDLPAWGRGIQAGGFLDGLLDGLRSVGEGIGNTFQRLKP